MSLLLIMILIMSELIPKSVHVKLKEKVVVIAAHGTAWSAITTLVNNTGHVIGLDLSSSFLYGSIDSSSTLFHLRHLTRLNLSYNDFNYSSIPSAIRRLSRLSLLDLSYSYFSGQIPAEILELSKLETLDLSGHHLKLQNPSLKSLAEKLVNLKYLTLNWVNISSNVPQSLANLSSLTSISLAGCALNGEFPVKVFQLPQSSDS